MEFHLTENMVMGGVGTIAAAIAAVVGRWLWKFINASENGGLAIGWGTALLAVTSTTFGGVQWDLQHDFTKYPSISKEETAETVKAKMLAYEAAKEDQQHRRAEASVPIGVAVPLTFLGPILGLFAFIRLSEGYQKKYETEEERRQAAKRAAELEATLRQMDARITATATAASSRTGPMPPSAVPSKTKCDGSCGR